MVGSKAIVTGVEFWAGLIFLAFLFSVGFWTDRPRRSVEPFRSDLPVIYNADKGWYEPARCM